MHGEPGRRHVRNRDVIRQTALEDLRREFPDWIVIIDRDFTGLCFAYRPTGSANAERRGPCGAARPDPRLAEEAR